MNVTAGSVGDEGTGSRTAGQITDESLGNDRLTDRRRRINVTDMDAASVQRYVRERIATDDVSIEHRGARTYLLVGE